MSCPCGSTKCICDEECVCFQTNCKCRKCALWSNFQTAESDTSYESYVRQDECPRCKLPIFLVDADCTERKVRYCRCPQKTRVEDNSEMQSEHETSSTSDHRVISADRHVRKTSSRKIRTQKSNWQAKKIKDHSSNSEECSYNNETFETETLVAETSNLQVARYDSSYAYMSSGDVLDEVINLNPNLNRSQRQSSSRTGETSTGNESLLVNTSGVSSQGTPKALGHLQSSRLTEVNDRSRLPYPFPRLPKPIPGPPAFGGLVCQSPNPNLTTPDPVLSQQAPVARMEKMERWFKTIQTELNKSGELPDAETAAKLDKLEKEQQSKEEQLSSSEDLPSRGSIAVASDSSKDKEDIEPTTDTDRSTSLSKSHKESESD